MAEVEYRDVPGFPGYRAGTDGSVWSNRDKRYFWTWRRLAQPVLDRGYPAVKLYPDVASRGKVFFVHTIILLTFVGPRPADKEACHNDGNRLNNRLDNLRWDTKSANSLDASTHGSARKKHPRLPVEAVSEIRRLRGLGISVRSLATQFAASERTIRRHEQVSREGSSNDH